MWIVLVEITHRKTRETSRGFRKYRSWNEVRRFVQRLQSFKWNNRRVYIEIYRGSLFKRIRGKEVVWE